MLPLEEERDRTSTPRRDGSVAELTAVDWRDRAAVLPGGPRAFAVGTAAGDVLGTGGDVPAPPPPLIEVFPPPLALAVIAVGALKFDTSIAPPGRLNMLVVAIGGVVIDVFAPAGAMDGR